MLQEGESWNCALRDWKTLMRVQDKVMMASMVSLQYFPYLSPN